MNNETAMLINTLQETIEDQTETIDRLRFALQKADKWGDVLGDLFDEDYLQEGDMG